MAKDPPGAWASKRNRGGGIWQPEFKGEEDAREATIDSRVRLGDLLIRANLVTEKDVTAALGHMREHGGRLGDSLIAVGAIDPAVLNEFMHRIPKEPKNIAETGIEESELLALLMKLIYSLGLSNVPQFTETIKLPMQMVMDLTQLAIERQLLYTLGARNSESPVGIHYALTEEGRRWTQEAISRSGYIGPAPVPLEEFIERVILQKPTNERITADRIVKALSDLTLTGSIVEQTGPALNSGRAILLYGPPGNGKTSVAVSFAGVFHDVIYVPYAIMVEGSIIRFHDPRIHVPISPILKSEDDSQSFIRR